MKLCKKEDRTPGGDRVKGAVLEPLSRSIRKHYDGSKPASVIM